VQRGLVEHPLGGPAVAESPRRARRLDVEVEGERVPAAPGHGRQRLDPGAQVPVGHLGRPAPGRNMGRGQLQLGPPQRLDVGLAGPRQQLEQPRRRDLSGWTVHCGQQRGDGGPVVRGHRVEHGFTHQRVPERVDGRRRVHELQQFQLYCLPQPIVEPGPLVTGDPHEVVEPESVTEHGGQPQQFAQGRAEAVEPGLHDRPDAVGGRRHGADPVHLPGPGLARPVERQQTLLGQPVQQLLDGERVGPGAGDHDGAKALDVGRAQPERLGDEVGHGGVWQRAQVDGGDNRTRPAADAIDQRTQRVAGPDVLGRVGADDHEGRLFGGQQAAERVDAVPVGPVQVVDHEHDAADVRSERGDQALHGQLQPVADVLGVGPVLRVFGRIREDGAPTGSQVDEEVGAAADGRGDLVEHGAGQRRERRDKAVEHRAERRIGTGVGRGRRGGDHGLLGRLREEPAEQRRLADPGHPGDADQPGPALVAGPVDGRAEPTQPRLAPDEPPAGHDPVDHVYPIPALRCVLFDTYRGRSTTTQYRAGSGATHEA
jgi:hypothetical protein